MRYARGMLMIPALIAGLLNARWLWVAALVAAGVGAAAVLAITTQQPVSAQELGWLAVLGGFWASAFKGVRLAVGLVVRRKPDADHAR